METQERLRRIDRRLAPGGAFAQRNTASEPRRTTFRAVRAFAGSGGNGGPAWSRHGRRATAQHPPATVNAMLQVSTAFSPL